MGVHLQSESVFSMARNTQRYFRLDATLGLHELGMLVGKSPEKDFCFASCSEWWYGNSRPLFINDRIYALIGYELIEGYFSDDLLYESNRVDGLELFDKNYLLSIKQ
jgi:hypothetical protein